MGLRLRDIGDELWWPELRNFIEHLEPGPSSALFRAQHPKSWWWTPDHDFYAAILTALQAGNWQRGGGKGARPKPVKRPQEKKVRKRSVNVEPTSEAELAQRRQALRDEIARRRKAVT